MRDFAPRRQQNWWAQKSFFGFTRNEVGLAIFCVAVLAFFVWSWLDVGTDKILGIR